jgi:cytochrome c-type biogenesis protein CcmE
MKERKVGAFVSGIVVLIAVACVSAAFLANASPYVTVSQARQISGDRLHLAGDLQPGTLVNDIAKRQISFQLKDQEGGLVTVVYNGDPQSSLSEATKIVAIGAMKDDKFYSDKLLIKCPSKYEGQTNPTTVAQSR